MVIYRDMRKYLSFYKLICLILLDLHTLIMHSNIACVLVPEYSGRKPIHFSILFLIQKNFFFFNNPQYQNHNPSGSQNIDLCESEKDGRLENLL